MDGVSRLTYNPHKWSKSVLQNTVHLLMELMVTTVRDVAQ